MTDDMTPGPTPGFTVGFDARLCRQATADVTAGCSFSCLYCPFSDLNARQFGVDRPALLALSPESLTNAPPSVFLSPASDPFAPQAAANTHALLAAWLPRGTQVGILTKGIVPQRTVDLLAEHRAQIEGVGIGVTSLDDERNRILEPGCPAATTRLENVDRIAAAGVRTAVRIDPLFPELDDTPEALAALVREAARRGAMGVVASYVFAWGRYLRRLRQVPLLAESCRHLVERAPMEGGTAWSVPVERKVLTYRLIAALAEQHGLVFGTCGCKDLRMQSQGFWNHCRLPQYLDGTDRAI